MQPYETKIRPGANRLGNRNYRCTIPKKLFRDNPPKKEIIFWINKKKQIVISPRSKDLKQVNGVFIPSRLHSNGSSYYVILLDRIIDSYIHHNGFKSANFPNIIENKSTFKIICEKEDFILF